MKNTFTSVFLKAYLFLYTALKKTKNTLEGQIKSEVICKSEHIMQILVIKTIPCIEVRGHRGLIPFSCFASH